MYTYFENNTNNINNTHYNGIKDNKNNNCLICLLPSHDNSIVLKMKDFHNIIILCNCNPNFHYSCLEEWFNYSSSCPICRKQLIIIKPASTNYYITKLTYFIFCFNFCIGALHIATSILLIHVFLLCIYNFYFMFFTTELLYEY